MCLAMAKIRSNHGVRGFSRDANKRSLLLVFDDTVVFSINHLIFTDITLVEERNTTNAHTSIVNNQTELNWSELPMSWSSASKHLTPKKRRLSVGQENCYVGDGIRVNWFSKQDHVISLSLSSSSLPCLNLTFTEQWVGQGSCHTAHTHLTEWSPLERGDGSNKYEEDCPSITLNRLSRVFQTLNQTCSMFELWHWWAIDVSCL